MGNTVHGNLEQGPEVSDIQENAIRHLYTQVQKDKDFAKFRSQFRASPSLGCVGGTVDGVYYGIEPDGYTHSATNVRV